MTKGHIIDFNADSLIEYARSFSSQQRRDAPQAAKRRKMDSAAGSPDDTIRTNQPMVTLVERVICATTDFAIAASVVDRLNPENGFVRNADGASFSGAFKLGCEPTDELLVVSGRSRYGLKEALFLLAIPGLDWRTLRKEVRLLREMAADKRPEGLAITGPSVRITINSLSRITTELHYKIELAELLTTFSTLSFVSEISALMRDLATVENTAFDRELESTSIDPSEAITLQLFYTAVSEHTALLPVQPALFDIPELETSLMKFQSKTLQWLLRKEGVEYDPSTNRCATIPIVSSEVRRQLQEGPDQVHRLLSRLCLGWHLVVKDNAQYWYNEYTANICTPEFAVLQLLKIFGGAVKTPAQGLLAEEMGLGKTVEITTLSILNPRPIDEINKPTQISLKPYGDLKTIPQAKTTLIIAPESILKQWVEEIVHLAPSLAVTVYQGLDKYPRLNKNANLIAEYLRGFDVVFTTYSTISRELDYANYSNTKKKTRSTLQSATNGGTDDSTLGGDDYQFLFQLTLPEKPRKNANHRSINGQTETDYEQALQEEIQLALKHNRGVPEHYRQDNNANYQTPLMLMQFWRVVLDEVQMVSSRVSRAFQSASLIPRFHAWGVSGTPIKRNLGDLHSVLRFLNVQPFGLDYYAKLTWEMLTNTNKRSNMDAGNRDFIRVWSQVSWRHTKAMVHDDIRLPPQNRVLLSIPFNMVEQENYNQMFSECLAAIFLDHDGNPVIEDWEPTNTVLAHMRYWLTRLRQVCCNPQVGRLNLGSRRYKSRHHMFYGKNGLGAGVNPVEQLKTLEDVLEDMLVRAADEIIGFERDKVELNLRVADFEEFTLAPYMTLKTLEAGLWDTLRIINRLEQQLKTMSATYKEKKKSAAEISAIESPVRDPEPGDSDAESEAEEVNVSDRQHIELVTYRERINTIKIRLRSWNVTLHKYYFLIASSHFQCYDEEYQDKVKRSGRDPALLDELGNFTVSNLLTNDISQLVAHVSTTDFKRRDPLEGFSGDMDSEPEVHQFQEQYYYSLAESTRQLILDVSMKAVRSLVKSKLSREAYSDFSDDGTQNIPKGSKKLFKHLPIIDVSTLEQYIATMKSKVYYDRVLKLVLQLNQQASVINTWMDELIDILCRPLLSHDKTPDGAEYEESIDDQDKASCLLHVLSGLLNDRVEFTLGTEASSKSATFKKQQETFTEKLSNVHNMAYLDDLQQKRRNIKPRLTTFLQQLALNPDELEGDDGAADSSKSLEVLAEMISRVRIIFENQKTAQMLLQKELSGNCNAVFNARIEYFKQLQQISDTVKTTFVEGDDVDIQKWVYRFGAANAEIDQKLAKSIAKFRYLLSLVAVGSADAKEDPRDIGDDLMCTICRSSITIGSLTQCGHKYCKDCLDHWLQNSNTCPMCKSYIREHSVYNFTHYKPNLTAKSVQEATGSTSGTGTAANLHVIYKPIEPDTIESIQRMELKMSYSTKVDLIIKQILYLRGKDPKVQIVIFSQWQDLLYIIGTALKRINVSFLASHGTLTPGVGGGRRRKKYDSVEDFKRPDSDITCFLLNAKAEASGLTLINATHIFLCEPLVNTSLELQAISRIHRIGQTKATTVWMFAIENTLEESIVVMSTNKRLRYFETSKAHTRFAKEEDISKADSMTMLQSGGMDTLVNRGQSEGETVLNGDLWDAFFSARTAPRAPASLQP
jgi:E3 ubiquitin-protein ligase SHPRH